MGTPCSTVTFAEAISASAPAASKAGCSTSVAPLAIVPSMALSPKTAENGTAASTRSSGDSSRTVAVRTAFSTRARCESCTPFGFPIVPDVYTTARSRASSERSVAGRGFAAPLDTRSSN